MWLSMWDSLEYKGTPEQGRKGGVFAPPDPHAPLPREQLHGIPLEHGGRWVELTWCYLRRDVPSAIVFYGPEQRYFPQLLMPPQAQLDQSYGRPSVIRADPEQAELIARCIDVLGWSIRGLAAELQGSWYPEGCDARNMTRDRYRAARSALRARGVLPWAAFGAGKVPKDWREHSDFAWAVDEWRRQAITQPAKAVPSYRQQIAHIFDAPPGRLPPSRADLDCALARVDRNPYRAREPGNPHGDLPGA